MGTYNTLQLAMVCPRCGHVGSFAVDTRFGYTSEMAVLRIGDSYPWAERKMPQNGGRPEGGSVDGEGYAECDHCRKDFFVRVKVRSDIIVGGEPDITQQGYIQ